MKIRQVLIRLPSSLVDDRTRFHNTCTYISVNILPPSEQNRMIKVPPPRIKILNEYYTLGH